MADTIARKYRPLGGVQRTLTLLLGFACEFLTKRRLMHEGVSEEALRKTPYGHDISGMWRVKTKLSAEAKSLVSELNKTPNPDGVDAHFDWDLHFNELAKAHSREGDYSLRYNHGKIEFANPIALTVVLGKIWLVEQEKASIGKPDGGPHPPRKRLCACGSTVRHSDGPPA